MKIILFILLPVTLFAGDPPVSFARQDLLGLHIPSYKLGSIKSDLYKWNKQKLYGAAIISVTAFIDGSLETWGYSGRTAFQEKWNVGEYSFFGSKSYQNKHTLFYRVTQSTFDFYHVADDARKIGYITGGFVLGLGASKVNKKWHHGFYDILLTNAISGIFKWAGHYYIKHINAF